MTNTAGSIFGARYRLVTLSVIALVALVAFDALAVIALLPSIGGDLGEVASLPWVVTAYLVASAIAIVGAGPLIDAFGLCRCFRATVTLHVLASLGCSLAPTFEALVVMRTAQGFGGGFVLATALATIGLAYPDQVRPRMVAAGSVVWGVAAIAGPSVAAGLVATVGWRAVFLVSVTLAGLAILMGWTRLPASPSPGARRMPFHPGSMALLTLLVVVSLVGVSSLSARAPLYLGAAALLALLYWRVSRRVPRPVLAPRYFTTMPFAAINLAGAACFGALLGLNSFLPVYVRAGLGEPEHVAALSVLFLNVGWSVSSMAGAMIVEHVERDVLTVAGYVVVVAGILAGLALYSGHPALPVVAALFFLKGIGLGIVALCTLTLLQEEADSAEIGRATAAFQFFRTLSYSYGAALSGGILLVVASASLGDMEPIRALLAGEALPSGAEMAPRAVAHGFRVAHLGALAFVACGVVAAVLVLRSRRASTDR